MAHVVKRVVKGLKSIFGQRLFHGENGVNSGAPADAEATSVTQSVQLEMVGDTPSEAIDTGIGLANDVFAIVKEVAGAFDNIPYVKSLSGVILKVIEIREELKFNKQRCREIIDKALRMAKLVYGKLKEVEQSGHQEQLNKLEGHLRKYGSALADIQVALMAHQSRSIFYRLINRGLIMNELNEHDRRLDELDIRAIMDVVFDIAIRLVERDTNESNGNEILVKLAERDAADALLRLRDFTVAAALHNSVQSEFNRTVPRCHPGTRVAILQKLFDWIVADNRKEWLLWLNGAAGAGKSAIMRSLAERCIEAHIPIATFFLRGDLTGSTVAIAHLFATLAYQLVQTIPETKDHILTIINNDPLIVDQSAERQLQSLIIEPLLRLQGRLHHRFAILIDGLDEFIDKAHQSLLIKVLGDILRDRNLPVVFLVASRRDQEIGTEFYQLEMQPSPIILKIQLDDFDINQTSDDIRRYLTDRFNDIKKTHVHRQTIPNDWPPVRAVKHIVFKSSGQFIFAAVVIQYVSSPRFNPTQQLDIILNIHHGPSRNPYDNLDVLYRHIFSQIEPTRLAKVLDIIAYMLLVANCPSAAVIEDLLELGPRNLGVYLADLMSVIEYQPKGYHSPPGARFLHQSLSDFLQDLTRSGSKYHIDLKVYGNRLLCNFLEHMSPSQTPMLSANCSVENLERNETNRLEAIYTILPKVEPLEELRHAFMSFNCTFYTFKMHSVHHIIGILEHLKVLFDDQGKTYRHVLGVFYLGYSRHIAARDDIRREVYLLKGDCPDLLASIEQRCKLSHYRLQHKLKIPLFALLIGINHYKASFFPSLTGAVPHALLFKTYLEECLGVPESQIILLTDVNATHSAIINALKYLRADERIHKDDAIFVYYAGHRIEFVDFPKERRGDKLEKIQAIVPHDCDVSEAGTRVPPILDYVLEIILSKIAEEKGDNITVVYDCLLSASGTRSIRKPSEEGKENDGDGQFSAALLKLLNEVSVDTLRYSDILKHPKIDEIHGQNPQCEGRHPARTLFNSKVLSAQRKVFDIDGEHGQYIVHGGTTHNIQIDSEFGIYRKTDLSFSAQIGILEVDSLQPFSFKAKLPPNAPPLDFTEPLIAVQTKFGRQGRLRIYIPPGNGFHKVFDEMMQNAQLNRHLDPVERVGDSTDCQVEIASSVDKKVTFTLPTPAMVPNQVTMVHKQVVDSEKVDQNGLAWLFPKMAHFYRELRYTNIEPRIANFVDIELYRLQDEYRTNEDTGYEEDIFVRVGPNLCVNNIVNLHIPDEEAENVPYGIRIVNKSALGLYANVFHFNTHELSISSFAEAHIGHTDNGPDIPLKGREGILDIGFGPAGYQPISFEIPSGLDMDIGYLKIYLSTTPVSLAYLPQTSPFTSTRAIKTFIPKPSVIWTNIVVPIILHRNAPAVPMTVERNWLFSM